MYIRDLENFYCLSQVEKGGLTVNYVTRMGLNLWEKDPTSSPKFQGGVQDIRLNFHSYRKAHSTKT